MTAAIIVGRDEADRKNYDWFIGSFQTAIAKLQPNLKLEVYPNIKNYADIDFVMVWRHPLGIFSKFPNLKCIAAMSAGVDHILVDKDLPKNIPIVRILDPKMAQDISQYVVANVLYLVKRLDHWQKNQQLKLWHKNPPFSLADKTIGILGLGFLGRQAAAALQFLGLKVIGWSNSPKNLTGVNSYVGQQELTQFLNQTDILICMLPLTPATQNILNAENFSKLQKNAYVINLGRGDHLIEHDLIAALDSGQLSGACLDVFREEPLPVNHPFWTHSKIRITPHIASVTNPETATAQILENYRRIQAHQPLLNIVDLNKGY